LCGASPAEAGVDLNAKDNWGNTPADEAFNESRGPALMLILKVRERA